MVKVKNLKEKQAMEKKPSKGPLSEYRDDKKRVGIEDMKKDMLKMMDQVDRLEDAFKFLNDRVNRIDGRG